MSTVFKNLSIKFAHRRIVLHNQSIAQLEKELAELQEYLRWWNDLSLKGVDMEETKAYTIYKIKAIEKEIAKFKWSRSRIFKKYLNKSILKKAEDKDNEEI